MGSAISMLQTRSGTGFPATIGDTNILTMFGIPWGIGRYPG